MNLWQDMGGTRNRISGRTAFRLNQTNLQPERWESQLHWRNGNAKASLTYTDIEGGVQELSGDWDIPLQPLADAWWPTSTAEGSWSFTGQWRRDLRTDTQLLAQAGLTYDHRCYTVEFTSRRRGYVNATQQPSTDVLLNLRLKMLPE